MSAFNSEAIRFTRSASTIRLTVVPFRLASILARRITVGASWTVNGCLFSEESPFAAGGAASRAASSGFTSSAVVGLTSTAGGLGVVVVDWALVTLGLTMTP